MDENPDGQSPRERLKAWRESRELSQAKAGAMIGVSGPAWCEWESGGRTPVEHRAALEVLTGIPAEGWATEREREAVEKALASRARMEADDAPTAPEAA